MRNAYTKAEVAHLLHVSEDSLDRMVADGRFPVGIKPTPQTGPVWTGLTLAAWFLIAPLLQRADAKGVGQEK